MKVQRLLGVTIAVLGTISWFTITALGILLADALVGQPAIVRQGDDPDPLFWVGESASILSIVIGAVLAVHPSLFQGRRNTSR